MKVKTTRRETLMHAQSRSFRQAHRYYAQGYKMNGDAYNFGAMKCMELAVEGIKLSLIHI